MRGARAVAVGSTLYRPGDRCAGFVVVRSGTIKVSLPAESGRELVLYRVGPGDVCLQTFRCLTTGQVYTAEATAETDLEIELIAAAEFERRLADDTEFRRRVFASVARRFDELETLVETIATAPIGERLARALLRLADDAHRVRATHETLAREIGSVREVVSRQLAVFARDALVQTSRGEVTILAPDRLALVSRSGRD